MFKYKLKTALIALGFIGSIGLIASNDCIRADHKIPLLYENKENWCMSEEEFLKEKEAQIIQIEKKEGVELEKIIALVLYDETHRKAVSKALVKEFKKDGYIDYDNYALHMFMVDELWHHLKAIDELPTWYFDAGEFTEGEIIDKIHYLLLK